MGASKKLGPLRISATVETSNFKFGIQLGFGTILPKKQRLRPKLAGVWARGSSKIIGTPYVFLQPLKLATSNLVHNLGLGLAYQRLRPKLAGVWARGAFKKIETPYLFLQQLKLATEKLVHNMSSGLPC